MSIAFSGHLLILVLCFLFSILPVKIRGFPYDPRNLHLSDLVNHPDPYWHTTRLSSETPSDHAIFYTAYHGDVQLVTFASRKENEKQVVFFAITSSGSYIALIPQQLLDDSAYSTEGTGSNLSNLIQNLYLREHSNFVRYLQEFSKMSAENNMRSFDVLHAGIMLPLAADGDYYQKSVVLEIASAVRTICDRFNKGPSPFRVYTYARNTVGISTEYACYWCGALLWMNHLAHQSLPRHTGQISLWIGSAPNEDPSMPTFENYARLQEDKIKSDW